MSKEENQVETEVTTTEIPVETSTEELQTSEESSEESGLVFEEPDFGAITDFVEGDVEEEEVLPVAAEAEIPETPPEETPEEVLAESEVSESTEAPEEETPPVEEVVEQVATPEIPEPEAVKFPTQEDLEGMYVEHRAKTLPELEKVFTLSDEEAAALDEQPSKVLPKLAAQLQYDVMLSTYNAVISALPSVMGTFSKASDLASQAQGQFLEAWPDLKDPKAEPVVKAAIQAYRAANPRADLETTIKNAGVMAMIQLGLDPVQKSPGKQAAPVAPKPRVAPPKPVSPTGQSPVPPVATPETNEFAELAEVFLNELR